MSSENISLSSLIEQTPIDTEYPLTNINDIDKLSLTAQAQEARIGRINQNTIDRTRLVQWTSLTVSIWLISVIILLFCNKSRFVFNLLGHKIDIIPNVSDNVLEVLLVTTTLNVLGLSFIVLRGLFNVAEQEKNT